MDDFNVFDTFLNQHYSALGDWLNTFSPYEFALIGVVAAFLIAPGLNANQQSSIGNFLEEIGQILLAISAQKITVEQAQGITNQGNASGSTGLYSQDNSNDNQNMNAQIEALKEEIERLKNLINQ